MPGDSWSLLGPSSTPAVSGRAWFEMVCAPCHGYDGRGGRVADGVHAPVIAGAPVERITAQVRSGGRHMPPVAQAALSDSDVAAVAAYVHGTLSHPVDAPAIQPRMGPRTLDPILVGLVAIAAVVVLCSVLSLLFAEGRN